MLGRRWFNNSILDAAAKGGVGGLGVVSLGVPIPFVLAAIEHRSTEEAGIIAGTMLLMGAIVGALYGTALGCYSYYRQDEALAQFGLFGGQQPGPWFVVNGQQIQLLPIGPAPT